MRPNPYTGDVPLEIAGKTWRLRFDWYALSAVKAEVGDDLEAIVTGRDLPGLATLIEIGLRRHHADAVDGTVSRAAIMLDPPPVTTACSAVTRAIDLAWNGPPALRKVTPNPLARARSMATSLARILGRVTRSPAA